MDKPVLWMTLELRHELERARQAWQARDLVGVLADGELRAVSQDAHRHQLVANELFRRPKLGPTSSALSDSLRCARTSWSASDRPGRHRS
jgi:hypothetical protein